MPTSTDLPFDFAAKRMNSYEMPAITGQQNDPPQESQPKRMKGQKHVKHHGNAHHDQKKTGATTGMKTRASARRRHINGAPLFKSPHHLVFSAVIFKHPLDFLPLRNQEQKPQE